MLSIQLHETEREDTCQRRGNTTNEVENGESLLDVIFKLSAIVPTPFVVILHRVYQHDSR
jgi:hypothetical protein